MIEPDSPRWRAVSEPRLPHEHDTRLALQGILPDRAPVRVWTGFEFEDRDGAIHRLDALVMTGLGLFALRTLRLAGRVEGDEHRWTVRRLDGRVDVVDHPAPALRRSVAALAERLAQRGADLTSAPIEPLVFLPEDELELRLPHSARQLVVTQEASPSSSFTLAQALLEGRYPGARRQGGEVLRQAAAEHLVGAIEAALAAGDLRRPDPGRRVGDYRLEHVLFEGPTFQDFLGIHQHRGERLRVRRFNQATRATAEARELVDRAARREHALLQGLRHPGVVPLLGLRASEIGPCLLYPDLPGAARLDHHIAAEGSRPDVPLRLRLLGQLADTLRFIHGEGIVLRALSPQAALVVPGTGGPQAAIFTWHAGARRGLGSADATATGTQHVPRLLEDQSHLYLAPEVRLGLPTVDEASDVFSLGAVACFVLSGRPPAANVVDLTQGLHQHGGLRLSALVDGLPAELTAAVLRATHPRPAERGTLDELAVAIERARALLDPPEAHLDLLDVPPDTVVEGWRIERTLGRGATGVALLARSPAGDLRVLKVGRTPADAERLRAEAAALARLEHPQIVRCHGLMTLGEREALVLDFAGGTLREALRGGLGEELAANLGSDLLSAVGHCLDRGVLHRDLKPENLGVAVTRREGQERKRLTLFDFSLAGLPLGEVRVGTPQYRDPFLAGEGGTRRPWDAAAELYAAGLVLHELVTGTVPSWGGDGQYAPPEMLHPTLEAERFPAGVRSSLLAFFQRALHRDPTHRFEDAATMRSAWRAALQVTATITPSLEAPRIDTPLVDLGLHQRVLNALERLGVRTAGDLALMPRNRVAFLPGVGAATRADLLALLARVAHLADEAQAHRTEQPDPAAQSLEALYEATRRGYKASHEVRDAYLGLTPGPSIWPAAAELAERGINSLPQVNKLLQLERQHWAQLPPLAALTRELIGLLDEEGGALTPEALAEALRLARHEDTGAQPYALALARIAVEVEATKPAPRLHLFRSGPRLVVTTDPGRVEWAWRLGDRADALASRNPLPGPADVVAELRTLDPETALDADRLVRLAAGFSRRAAATARHELYPRDLAPERALVLARVSVLAGSTTWTPDELRTRVSERFPAAQPLPEAPALIELVQRTGLPLTWDPTRQRFELQAAASTRQPHSSTTSVVEYGYVPAFRRPEDARPPEAQAFDDWLTHAAEPGAWAIITTRVRTHLTALDALTRRAPPGAVVLDLEARLLAGLHTEAQALRIPFDTLLKADAHPPTSVARQRLQTLVDAACRALQTELLTTKAPLIILHRLGLLARYGRLDLLEALRAALQSDTAAARAAWLVVPVQNERGPVIDGQALPLVTRAQHMRLPGTWLEGDRTAA